MPYTFKGLLMAIVATLTFTLAGMRQAQADPVVLTFDGLQGGEPILNFYNGGSGGSGSGPDPTSASPSPPMP